MHDLTGKVAFISGAGSVGEGWGNGKATAVLLARQGATIYGTDIALAAAEETRALIAAEGGTAHAAAVDMTKARRWRRPSPIASPASAASTSSSTTWAARRRAIRWR